MSSPAASNLLVVLAEKKQAAQKEFARRHAFAEQWLARQHLTLDDIRAHSTRLLTGATLGSALLLTSPNIPLLVNSPQEVKVKLHKTVSQFISELSLLPANQLTSEQEAEITANVQELYGVSTAFELDQNRIPYTIGLMGLEQHLYRFPTDTLAQHVVFQEAGIAPARGAFGYFAETGKSPEQMVAQEEYYIVLQTFLIPEWNSNWQQLKDWYKFRKFLVINVENGKAVVAVLGDSGPGVSTGKKFGGSPEVMAALGWYPQKTKGKTLVLFLDDPGNQIPLGPVAPKEQL